MDIRDRAGRAPPAASIWAIDNYQLSTLKLDIAATVENPWKVS